MGMIKFKLSTHQGESMVEVWRDDLFVASTYGHEDGMLLVSKYFDGVETQHGYPPGVLLRLSEEVKDVKG